MSTRWRTLLQMGVIAAGGLIVLESLLALRLADWLSYVTFWLLLVVVYPFYVEAIRDVPLPIPQMATTIGFLYIVGLPIVSLTMLATPVLALLRRSLPARWQAHVPHLHRYELLPAARHDLFTEAWRLGGWVYLGLLAESATYLMGLRIRWWIVTWLAAGHPPTSEPWAMAVAEIGGYLWWGMLSLLPIYPDRPLLRFSSEGGFRTALDDIQLMVGLTLTPFVFLIAYGFRAEGLPGAVAWSFSTLGLHFVLKRLTERRLKVEEQNRRLETLNRELEHRERLSAIGKMSSVVSHQILQQLGVIGIYADLIRNADGSADPQAILAQTRRNSVAIENALGDVNRVLTDLLVFSKDLRLHLYEHPLRRTIEECFEECRTAATDRGIRLRSEGDLDATATFDKLKIKQALVNLIRNAIDASSIHNEVVVAVARRDHEVDISVTDQGSGVPEGERDAIFTPFFTTKESGSGLGLAIARQFTDAHGGRLWVESRPGGPGACFTLRLPLAGPSSVSTAPDSPTA